jgi:hypothetical protein
MTKQIKCLKCGKEFPKITEHRKLCYNHAIEMTESDIKQAKNALKKVKGQLEEALAKGEEAEIKQAKKTVQYREKCLIRSELAHLEVLMVATEDLTTLEDNYKKVKSHSHYSTRKEDRKKLDEIYRKHKSRLEAVEKTNSNKENNNQGRERERERQELRGDSSPKERAILLLTPVLTTELNIGKMAYANFVLK